MKAVVKTKKGIGNVGLVDWPKPFVSAGQVLIKVVSAGVCGTDVKILHDQASSNPPVVLGHEYSGIVDEVGKGVNHIFPGDRVVSETAQVICGACEYCKSGRGLMCPKRLSIGYGVDGAFAEYIEVRQELVHKIPDNVSFDVAALCEPFAVALHGVWDRCSIDPTDVVLVMGPGAIGQLTAVAAMLKGAAVVLAGTSEDTARLETAKSLGIPYVVHENLSGFINQLTNGRGVDAVLDCTGSEAAIRESMPLVKRTGQFIQIGLSKPVLEIEYSLLTGKEISIIGTFGHQYHNWKQALCMFSKNKLDFSKLISTHYSIEEWKTAFSDMENKNGIKVLIHPNSECLSASHRFQTAPREGIYMSHTE